MWVGPVHCGQCHPWAGRLDLYKKGSWESEPVSSTQQDPNRREGVVPVKRAWGGGMQGGASIQSRAVDGTGGVLLDTLTLRQHTFKTAPPGAQHHPSKLLEAQDMCGMLNAVLAPKEID